MMICLGPEDGSRVGGKEARIIKVATYRGLFLMHV